MISFYCGQKNASQGILIDKKLRNEFLNKEKKQKDIKRKIVYYKSIIDISKRWGSKFKFAYIFIFILLIIVYLLNMNVIQFILDPLNLSIIGVLLVLNVIIKFMNTFSVYQFKRLQVLLTQEQKQETNIANKVLKILGTQLREKIEMCLKSSTIHKECQTLPFGQQDTINQQKKEIISLNQEVKKEQLNSQKYKTEIQLYQEKINQLIQQQQQQKTGRQNQNDQNGQCGNEVCQQQKCFYKKKIQNYAKFMKDLQDYKWCNNCKILFHSSSDNQKNQEVQKNSDLQEQNKCDCLEKYFKFCQEIGKNFMENSTEINKQYGITQKQQGEQQIEDNLNKQQKKQQQLFGRKNFQEQDIQQEQNGSQKKKNGQKKQNDV